MINDVLHPYLARHDYCRRPFLFIAVSINRVLAHSPQRSQCSAANRPNNDKGVPLNSLIDFYSRLYTFWKMYLLSLYLWANVPVSMVSMVTSLYIFDI